ncbi:cytochrome c551 [Bacillus sp. AK128]
MKSKVMVILLGLLLTLTACGGGGDTAQEETTDGGTTTGGTTEVSEGEKLYRQSCANCHGGNLEGNIGPALENVGSKYSEEDILHIIHEGQGSMPKGVLQGSDAEVVAAWLATMK